MDRRAFLVAAGVAIAGCTGGSETESPSDETGTGSASETGELAVTDVSVPGTVGIGSTVSLSVTVRNDADAEESYESSVSRRIRNGEWTELDTTVEISVPAGETVTEDVAVPAYEYLAAGTYRLDDGEHLARTAFVKRELELGESYTTPNGVRLTVSDVTFPDSYTYDTGDGTETIDAAEGEKLAVTHLSAENTTDSTVRTPGTEEAVLRRDEHEFGDMSFDSNVDKYTGGELEAGARIEGNIASDVPVDERREDLRVGYEQSFEEGEAIANWSLT
ncbi:hypothetical protein [Natrinema sp. DC36]|uniref:hypothetical protein n=1 Tax=Natrinema sp. DC36 TaxID=2878680 RepID=UPI001CEFEA1E|nr:hypothetical protein [Natrinema sp. DC36]